MKLARGITIVVVLAIVCALPLAAQKSGVLNTVHNISSNGCKSCHAPHNGSVATGGSDQSTGKILLWARAFSTQTFGTYTSPTMGNTPTEVGGGTAPTATEVRIYSLLCMSCHDGVTTPLVIGPTATEAVGNPTNSFGLQNDHPVNMSHDPANDAGLKTVAQVNTAGLVLYGTGTNTVQCASCHNVHNNTNQPFLRMSNTASGLCLACHI